MGWRIGGFILTALVGGLLLLRIVPVSADPPTGLTSTPSAGQVPGMPKPFAHWPAGKPDAVIVLTGQTWGYLRPCGCSAKQLGGLERRQNFIDSLKAKGWPVTAVDLGDVTAPTGLPEQVQLKYQTQLQAYRAMGYVAVGIGKYDFVKDLDTLTGKYSLQTGNEVPRLLAANLVRKSVGDRAKSFARGGKELPYVDDSIAVKVGEIGVGVVGTIDSQCEDPKVVTDEKVRIDRPKELLDLTKEFTLLGNQAAIPAALAKLNADPLKPSLKVLLYQGSKESAIKVAGAFKEFQIVLCLSDDALPPMLPEYVNDGKTAICQVGHKGQYLGVAGAFKQADGSFKIEYQMIELTEEYLTPKDEKLEAKHDVLKVLQKYAEQVRDDKFLDDVAAKKVQHNAQIRSAVAPKFTGSQVCRNCHPNEADIHEKTKHANALSFLENPKYSNRPTLRNFDPECVICHVVGFEYKSGFENVTKTPNLSHVGCESCHGPGSGHAKDPTDKVLLGFLSPWKTKPGDRLPTKELMADIGKTEPFNRTAKLGKIELNQMQVINAITKQCMTCHDPENDPKFDLYEYMPKIWHSGFKPVGK